jgi:peptidoglycan/LPS O-acetylase OafA/YrhL
MSLIAAPAGPPVRDRLSQLDGLRGLAITGVLLSHFYPRVFDLILPLGRYGVLLFFVLSGYLITGKLLDARQERDSGLCSTTQAFGRFYGRRVLRLFPALWLALLVGSLYLPEVRDTWRWHVAYASNFLVMTRGSFPGFLGHLWSLSVEEQFYLVWPVLVLVLPGRWIVPAVLGFVTVAPVHRYFGYVAGNAPIDVLRTIMPPWAYGDALGMGALLVVLARRRTDPTAFLETVQSWAMAVGLPMLVLRRSVYHIEGWQGATEGLAVALISVSLVAGAVAGFRGALGYLLDSRPLRTVGLFSYGLYLYHPLVLAAYIRWAPGWLPQHQGWGPAIDAQPPFTWAMATFFLTLTSLSIAVAWLSWRYFERPILSLKDRIGRSMLSDSQALVGATTSEGMFERHSGI